MGKQEETVARQTSGAVRERAAAYRKIQPARRKTSGAAVALTPSPARDQLISETLVQKTEFIIVAVGGPTRLANLLGVSKSQPTRWRQGKEAPSGPHARNIVDLDAVITRANLIWEPEVANTWLISANSYLDGARPIDVLQTRGVSEVLEALDAAEAGAFG